MKQFAIDDDVLLDMVEPWVYRSLGITKKQVLQTITKADKPNEERRRALAFIKTAKRIRRNESGWDK
jgi:hypothetical protein